MRNSSVNAPTAAAIELRAPGHLAYVTQKPPRAGELIAMAPAPKGKPAVHYEFFGPHGPALLVFVLPLTLYGLIAGCNATGCLALWPSIKVPGFPSGMTFWSWEALYVYVGWFAVVLGLHLVLPGTRAEGVILPNGKRLTYKLNGEHAGGANLHDARGG